MTMPNKTFVVKIPPGLDKCPFPFAAISKHVGGCHVPTIRKLFVGGGDVTNSVTNDSGNPQHYTYDVAANAYVAVTGICGAPGTITPQELEESPYAYDLKRDKIWASIGASNPVSDGSTCALSANGFGPGSTNRKGTMSCNPNTFVWTQELNEANAMFSSADMVYDPYHDELITGGTSFQHFALSGGLSRTNPLNHNHSMPDEFDSGTQSGYASEGNISYLFAADLIGRKIYTLLVASHYTAGANFVGYALRFWRYDIDTHAFTKLADPPYNSFVDQGECRPLWDAKNRAVIFPYCNSPDGVIHQMFVYDTAVASPVWTEYAVTISGGSQVVRGNRGFYSPDENLCHFGGTAFGVSNIDATFQWRYK